MYRRARRDARGLESVEVFNVTIRGTANRVGQVTVVGGMLAYNGVQRERLWLELMHLSQPVARRGGSINAAVVDAIDYARALFAVPRVVFVWEMREEPGWHIVHTGDSPPLPALPADYSGPVASALAGAAFDVHAETNEGAAMVPMVWCLRSLSPTASPNVLKMSLPASNELIMMPSRESSPKWRNAKCAPLRQGRSRRAKPKWRTSPRAACVTATSARRSG